MLRVYRRANPICTNKVAGALSIEALVRVEVTFGDAGDVGMTVSEFKCIVSADDHELDIVIHALDYLHFLSHGQVWLEAIALCARFRYRSANAGAAPLPSRVNPRQECRR